MPAIPIVRAKAILEEKMTDMRGQIADADKGVELLRVAATPGVISFDAEKNKYTERDRVKLLPVPVRRVRAADGSIKVVDDEVGYAALIEGKARTAFKSAPSLEMRMATEDSIVLQDKLARHDVIADGKRANELKIRVQELEIAHRTLDALLASNVTTLEIPGNGDLNSILIGCASAAGKLIAPAETPTWWPGSGLFPYPTFVNELGQPLNGLVQLSQKLDEQPGPLTILVDPEGNGIWKVSFSAVEGFGLIFGNVQIAMQRGMLGNWPAAFAPTPRDSLIRLIHPEDFDRQVKLVNRMRST